MKQLPIRQGTIVQEAGAGGSRQKPQSRGRLLYEVFSADSSK